MDAFNEYVDGQFIWTAKSELESKWDYIKAYDMGWIKPKETWSNETGIFTQ